MIASDAMTTKNCGDDRSPLPTMCVAKISTQPAMSMMAVSKTGALMASIRLIFICSSTSCHMTFMYLRRSNRSALAPLTTRMPTSWSAM